MLDQANIDAHRDLPIAAQQHFINGEWVDSASGAHHDVISPVDGQVFSSLADGDAEDVNRAVIAARHAFEQGAWSRSAPDFRKKILFRWADLIEAHALELAVLGVRDYSKFDLVAPIRLRGVPDGSLLITDREPPENIRAALSKTNIRFTIAKS